MTNKTNLPPIDLKQFEADTRFDIRDAMPELAVFSILWHNMGYEIGRAWGSLKPQRHTC